MDEGKEGVISILQYTTSDQYITVYYNEVLSILQYTTMISILQYTTMISILQYTKTISILPNVLLQASAE